MEFLHIKLYLHTNEGMIGLISAISVLMIILVLMGLIALLIECALTFRDIFKFILKYMGQSGPSGYASDLERMNMIEVSEPLIQPTRLSFNNSPRQAHASNLRAP